MSARNHCANKTNGRIFGAYYLVWIFLLLGCGSVRSKADTRLAYRGPNPHFVSAEDKREPLPTASYRWLARLDAERHEVHGKGTIKFKNPSLLPTKEVYFHHYLNAFESPKTLFRRGKGSRSGVRSGVPGSLQVLSLRSSTLGGGDLLQFAEPHSPGDIDDRTDIRVELPRPIAAEESVEFEVEFVAKLPEIVERSGYAGSYHLIAQWFPKLAKREVDGTWAHFPFHPHGEFYADFGNYDVTMDVPAEYIVGSTGKLMRSPNAPAGRAVYRAEAQNVHDFAWTAWPGFVVETRIIDDIEVRVLRPAHTPRAGAIAWDTMTRGLAYLGMAYGKYPYPQITIVHPPQIGQRSGGMEYPQFITSGGDEMFLYTGLRHLERVVIHELAHQWFQGMIATNEMAHPFLDEGLSSFAEARYLTAEYGAGSLLDLPGLQISRLAVARYADRSRKTDQPISLSAPAFSTFSNLASLVYARTTLCLETLGRVYSFERLDQALNDYATSQRYAHPGPPDFYAALEAAMGADVKRQAELMLNGSGTIDLAIGQVQTRREGGDFQSTVELKKTGDLALPYSVLVEFKDKSQRHFHPPPSADKPLLVFKHRSAIQFVHVDPKRTIVLDKNLFNNRRWVWGSGLAAKVDRETKRAQAPISALALASWILLLLAL